LLITVYKKLNKEVKEHNERFEFLGDSVLGLITSGYLYRELPSNPEGAITIILDET